MGGDLRSWDSEGCGTQCPLSFISINDGGLMKNEASILSVTGTAETNLFIRCLEDCRNSLSGVMQPRQNQAPTSLSFLLCLLLHKSFNLSFFDCTGCQMPDSRKCRKYLATPPFGTPLGTLDFYIGRSARADLKGRRAPLPLAPLP